MAMSQVNAAENVSTDEDLQRLERMRLQALVERDFERAAWFHSPDFNLITPRGSNYSRESYFEAMKQGRIVYLKWAAGEIVVRRFESVALLRYQADLTMPGAAGEAESFKCWHTDSYELRSGLWQVVWSQATGIR
jgi:hypothetical protein